MDFTRFGFSHPTAGSAGTWLPWYPYKMVNWIGFAGKSSLKTKVFTIKYRVFRFKAFL
jgi:hypothetical protein